MIKAIYKHLFFVLFAIISLNTKAQEISSAKFDSLYIIALNYRWDLLISNGRKYIEPNEQTQRIKSNFDELSVYRFPNHNELFKIAHKNGKSLMIYRITHKIISPDTIDINFGIVNLTTKKGIFLRNGLHFKKANFSLSCDGTNGYEPDFRFVYSSENKKWIIIYNKYAPNK